MADPALGGAPQLLVHKFELRVLALAPGAAAGHSPSKRFHRDTEGVDGSTGGDRGREDSRDDDSGNMGRGGIGVDGGGISVPGEVLSASTVETHPFDADENALCMSLVRLEQGGSPRMHVAVGTGMNDAQGEDKAVSDAGSLFRRYRWRGPLLPSPPLFSLRARTRVRVRVSVCMRVPRVC